MATKKLIQDTVTFFLTLTPRRATEEEKDILVKTYLQLFQDVSDKEFREGCYQYADENDFYPPVPHKLAVYMPKKKKDKHKKEERERYTCKACSQVCYAMSDEGICLDCAGFPPIEYAKRPGPPNYPKKEDYKIEGRIKCQKCGTVGVCIQEPRGTGPWECRQCYSGLTMKEISSRFHNLMQMIDIKGFKPQWALKFSDVRQIEQEIPF